MCRVIPGLFLFYLRRSICIVDIALRCAAALFEAAASPPILLQQNFDRSHINFRIYTQYGIMTIK